MQSPSGTGSLEPKLPPRVTDERTVNKFRAVATNISGTSTNLNNALAELETELKQDLQGKHEYEAYLKTTLAKKADLEKRVEANKHWIAEFEKNDSSASFEGKYQKLISDISTIYKGAKEHHAAGIALLIKEFNYHASFKRWNDTFTATPFTPK